MLLKKLFHGIGLIFLVALCYGLWKVGEAIYGILLLIPIFWQIIQSLPHILGS